jgi:hypothetical protein
VTLKTYSGSCHCGAVRFETDVDLSKGTVKCNCSSCAKTRAWLVFASPDHFRLIAGADSQGLYQWTPPGRAAPTIHYQFCKTCGIRTPSHGAAKGQVFHAIQVALLDYIDPDELAAAPIQYVDGRHDHFDRPPADTRLL